MGACRWHTSPHSEPGTIGARKSAVISFGVLPTSSRRPNLCSLRLRRGQRLQGVSELFYPEKIFTPFCSSRQNTAVFFCSSDGTPAAGPYVRGRSRRRAPIHRRMPLHRGAKRDTERPPAAPGAVVRPGEMLRLSKTGPAGRFSFRQDQPSRSSLRPSR